MEKSAALLLLLLLLPISAFVALPTYERGFFFFSFLFLSFFRYFPYRIRRKRVVCFWLRWMQLSKMIIAFLPLLGGGVFATAVCLLFVWCLVMMMAFWDVRWHVEAHKEAGARAVFVSSNEWE